jgi:hypothetical protein
MPTLDIDGQQFCFDDTWRALKYDDARLPILKSEDAVDVVALDRYGRLYLMEAKDYSTSQRSQAHRDFVTSGALLGKLAEKFRWSILGLFLAATRHRQDAPALLRFADALCKPETEIRLVAWIEHAFPDRSAAKAHLNYLGDRLKQKLRWLGQPKALLLNSSTGSLTGLTVSAPAGRR